MMDKEVVEKMSDVSRNLARMLEMALRGFTTMTEKSVKEAEEFKKEVQKSSAELASLLISRNARPLLSISSIFDRMGYNIEGIVDRLRRMVQEDIPFSDRAVKETTHIFQEVIPLLENLPDLIFTRNKMLFQHMEEKSKALFKEADASAEEHERRLIEGVCMPKASPVYLGIIESLKAITMHVADLSERIVSLPLKP